MKPHSEKDRIVTIEQAEPQRRTVAQTITHYAPMIAEALPKHIDPDRFTRLALTTLRKTPALQRCNPESFVGALLTASALGLEPDVMGECYLMPYKGECTLIVGYQGLSKLFWMHPLAARLSAEYVCERDEFDFDKGTDAYIRHKPAVGDRGKVIAYYAIVGLKNGATWFDVFTPAQITKLRGTTKAGTIPDPEHWMARKTALKQVLKLAPKATQMAAVQSVDEQVGSIQRAAQIAHVEVPDGVDPDTGEVLEGELMDTETDGPMFGQNGGEA